MTERRDLVVQAFKEFLDGSDTRPAHASIVEKAIESIGLREATNVQELLSFLAERVQFWAEKAEHAVNGQDFRQCKAEAQVALLLYRLALARHPKVETDPDQGEMDLGKST